MQRKKLHMALHALPGKVEASIYCIQKPYRISVHEQQSAGLHVPIWTVMRLCTLVVKCLTAGSALHHLSESDVVVLPTTVCPLVMIKEVLVSAPDCSKLDMLSFRGETRAKVIVGSGKCARVLASAALVDCGGSGTCGCFACLLLPTALGLFR